MREILDLAVELMTREGVAALSLAEVARQLGIRPPSLYEYFPSKVAIYDALFERGTREMYEVLNQYRDMLAADPLAALVAGQQAQIAWVQANPVLAQLMYWRPVPGFEPSARAYQPALDQVELLHTALRAAVDAGGLRPDAASEEGIGLYLALFSGVISQLLANEPGVPVDTSQYVRLVPTALEMFFRYYESGKDASR